MAESKADRKYAGVKTAQNFMLLPSHSVCGKAKEPFFDSRTDG